MEKDTEVIIDRIFNSIDNIAPNLGLSKRIEMALMTVLEVRSQIPMYTGELNPKWKKWEDARIELMDKLRYLRK